MSDQSQEQLARYRDGYAVFVKLWQLTFAISAPDACRVTSHLDAAFGELSKEPFFPNPTGGAIIVKEVEEALQSAVRLSSYLIAQGIEASIGIDHGTFEKVYNVTGWNTTAIALNVAARMAHWPVARGKISVTRKVKVHALGAGATFAAALGPEQQGKVKATDFSCHLLETVINADPISPPVPLECPRPFGAHVLVVDIERYSEKSGSEQQHLVDALSKCVDFACSATSAQTSQFSPAGDGGYFVFASTEQASAGSTLLFARVVIEHARSAHVPIRTGIAFGPVIKTGRRPAVGGIVLKADVTSAHAPTFGLAMPIDDWDVVPEPFRDGWRFQGRKTDLPIGPIGLLLPRTESVGFRESDGFARGEAKD
jgi:hypothetical protein